MKKILFLCLGFWLVALTNSFSQHYDYDMSPDYPFGLPNPEAPPQILDWAPLIGECDCRSVSRTANQEWKDTVDMIWRWKYILNGMGVQDETLKEDGRYAGSIRQYLPDSARWYVHYYSSPGASPKLPAWGGNVRENGNIVLYREQKAPNGMEGFYKITFHDISERGFNWLGEWVPTDESFTYPTWKIFCTKRQQPAAAVDRQKILNNARNFSKAYINGDYEGIANAYTTDAKIFPAGANIIAGREAIKKRWTLREGYEILHHQSTPEEIKLIGSYAYDYGYYEGKTQNPDGEISSWKGKYVIVWKKVDEDWKMYLDIWNRVGG